MQSFLRAVRLCFNYKFTLAGALLSAVAVAVLWGGNLGIVYPFVQVVVHGKSMREWLDDKVVERQQEIQVLEERLASIEDELAEAGDDQSVALRQEQSAGKARLYIQETKLAGLRRAEPWIDRYTPAKPFPTLVMVILFLMGGTLVKSGFLLSNLVLVDRVSELALFDLRKEFYRRTLRLDLDAFDKARTSDLMSRFTSDAKVLTGGLTSLFGRAVLEPLKMIVCLSIAAFFCWRLLLFSLVLVPIAVFVIKRLTASLKRANRRAMEENSGIFGLLTETFTGIQAVKAFCMERYERNRFHLASKQFFRKSMRITLFRALVKPCSEIMGIGVISMAILAGVYLVLNEQTHIFGIRMTSEVLSLPALMAFFAALAGISDPGRKLSDVITNMQSGIAAADRVYEMFDREPAIDDPSEPFDLPEEHRSISFEGIHFHYRPEEPVLRGIDLTINRGDIVALMGPNGCGKTTLMNLIPRFYDPVSGVSRMDGIDLRQARLRDIRGRIGMVSQQTLLFDDTVANNIRYGSIGATDEEVVEAARKAYALGFIEEQLEEGFDTLVGPRGSRLSGGQRQRVALARAILRDPQILLLDEATSQIDVESEQLIHEALSHFVRGRTTIMITHRLSTLQLAHRIVIMEKGRIADCGSHEELLARSELYARLYQGELRKSA